MARNSERARADWLERICSDLQVVTEISVQVLVEAKRPMDVAEAEKRARAAGVMARTAKIVAGMIPPTKRGTQPDHEEEMSEDNRDISDAELAELQAEFFARVDHLVAAYERKAIAAGLDPEPAAPRTGGGLAEGGAVDAEAERCAGLAN